MTTVPMIAKIIANKIDMRRYGRVVKVSNNNTCNVDIVLLR